MEDLKGALEATLLMDFAMDMMPEEMTPPIGEIICM